MINKKYLSIAAGSIISVVFLLSSFYRVNFHEFFHSLRNINYVSLLIFMFLLVLHYLLRAFIWRITTAPMAKIRLSTLFGGVVVGFMVNGVLPLRAGELFRAHYLSAVTGFRRSTVLATIFIERIFDVFCLGLLLIVGLYSGMHGLSPKTARVVLLVWFVAVAASVLLVMNLDKVEQNRHKLVFLPQRLLEMIIHFLAPLRQLRNVAVVIYLTVLIFLVWLCSYAALFSLIYHSVPAMRYEAALLLFLFVNIGMLIPAAPGALGVMQMAFWFSLAQFGVPKESALALSFAVLFVTYAVNLSIGLPFFLHAHLKLGEISQ